MFFVVRRATLLIPSGPADDPERRHLFICLTDPVGAERETLLVSISSLRPALPHDSTCRLFAGDHPFIRQDSFVAYRQARIEQAASIERGVQNGVRVPREILDGGIFARVCKGLTESRFVTPAILDFYLAATAAE